MGEQTLTIRITAPRDRDTGEPTSRSDWIQGVSEAAMGGMRAWCMGAGLVVEPTTDVEEVVVSLFYVTADFTVEGTREDAEKLASELAAVRAYVRQATLDSVEIREGDNGGENDQNG